MTLQYLTWQIIQSTWHTIQVVKKVLQPLNLSNSCMCKFEISHTYNKTSFWTSQNFRAGTHVGMRDRRFIYLNTYALNIFLMILCMNFNFSIENSLNKIFFMDRSIFQDRPQCRPQGHKVHKKNRSPCDRFLKRSLNNKYFGVSCTFLAFAILNWPSTLCMNCNGKSEKLAVFAI